MAKPTIEGRLGFFFDGGVNDKWIHDGFDWVAWPQNSVTVDVVPSHITGAAGSNVLVTNEGTTKNALFKFTVPKGDKGDTGSVPTVNVVPAVITGLAGTDASVSDNDAGANMLLEFTVPRGSDGIKGDDGDAPTVAVNATHITGAAGSSVEVEDLDTGDDVLLRFTIPKGDAGTNGNNGTTPTVSVQPAVITVAAGQNASVADLIAGPNMDLEFTIPRGADGVAGDDGKGWSSTSIITTGGEYKIHFISSEASLEFTTDNLLGPKGDDGTGVIIKGSDTHANIILKSGAAGDMWITTNSGAGFDVGDGMISDGLGTGASHWTNVGPIKGPQGDQGIAGTAANISGATATSIAPSAPATVSVSGPNTARTFAFGIPRGADGTPGTAANITGATATTLLPGTNATVSLGGTVQSRTFAFGIPRGDKGEVGNDSTVQGPKGDAATIQVGTTTEGPATVTNSGTTHAAVFDFKVPKGATGNNGTNATISVNSTVTGLPGTDALVTVDASSTATNKKLNFTIPKGDSGVVAPENIAWAFLVARQVAGNVHVWDRFIISDRNHIKIEIKFKSPDGMSWFETIDDDGIITVNKVA